MGDDGEAMKEGICPGGSRRDREEVSRLQLVNICVRFLIRRFVAGEEE